MPLGDALPQVTRVNGNPHMLAYITPDEAALLRAHGGGVTEGGGQLYHNGVPAFDGGSSGGDGAAPDSPNPYFDLLADFAQRAAQVNEAERRQRETAAARTAVADALRGEFERLFNPGALNARAGEIVGANAGAVDAEEQRALEASLAGLDPALRASPLGNSLARGVRDRATAARGNLRAAAERANNDLFGQDQADLAARLARVNASDNPWSIYEQERAGIENRFRAAQSAPMGLFQVGNFAPAAPPAFAPMGDAAAGLGGASRIAREGLFSSGGSSRLVR